LVVGFAFNQGSFQAVETSGALVEHSVPPAVEGTLDHALASTGLPALLLDLANARAGTPVGDWLASKPATRWIGSMYADAWAEKFQFRPDVRAGFDVLAFIETTTAARPNPSGLREMLPRIDPAPEPTNLQLAGTGAVPGGWFVAGSRGAHRHTVAVSDVLSTAGRRAACISRPSAPWRWGEGQLCQTFSAVPWRGRLIRLEASVRTEVEEPGSGAQLFIEIRPEATGRIAWDTPPMRIAILERPVRGWNWDRYGVAVDVPEAAHSITIGLAMAGNGAAWFGDVELKSDECPQT
jgi:hypothetical protein